MHAAPLAIRPPTPSKRSLDETIVNDRVTIPPQVPARERGPPPDWLIVQSLQPECGHGRARFVQ